MKIYDVKPPKKVDPAILVKRAAAFYSIGKVIDLRDKKVIAEEIKLRQQGCFKKTDLFPNYRKITIN